MTSMQEVIELWMKDMDHALDIAIKREQPERVVGLLEAKQILLMRLVQRNRNATCDNSGTYPCGDADDCEREVESLQIAAPGQEGHCIAPKTNVSGIRPDADLSFDPIQLVQAEEDLPETPDDQS